MSAHLSDTGRDVLSFIEARVKRQLEVRISTVSKAFRTIDVVDYVRSLERAGYIRTCGARGSRIELINKETP